MCDLMSTETSGLAEYHTIGIIAVTDSGGVRRWSVGMLKDDRIA